MSKQLRDKAQRSFVQVTTAQMATDVGITLFQFGTVPAPAGAFELLAATVPPATTTGQRVFAVDRAMVIPTGQNVCFNLRFELNVHNSASLQVRLTPQPTGAPAIDWRWAAPIGYLGTWSAAEQQAPWFDDGMDYCINIQPDGTDISVRLAEHSAAGGPQCAFLPPQPQHPMVRSTI